jgi:hypothetical protein
MIKGTAVGHFNLSFLCTYTDRQKNHCIARCIHGHIWTGTVARGVGIVGPMIYGGYFSLYKPLHF